jgi:4-hydroxybenzoate polyprenyltransferase
MLNTVKTFDIKGMVISSTTLLLSLLFYRVSDEFKDEETDKEFFPDRPFPSGKVKRQDLIFLLYFSAIGMLAINLFALSSLLYGIGLIAFCLLMGKWFFMEKYIADNRLMAFLTHSPVSIVMHLYVAAVFCLNNGILLYNKQNLLLILILSLPGFNWEVFRKTFTSERVGYQTYSSLLGYKRALALGNVFTILIFSLLFFIDLHYSIKYFLITLTGLYLVYGSYLSLSGNESKLNLQQLSESYNGLVLLALIINGHFVI